MYPDIIIGRLFIQVYDLLAFIASYVVMFYNDLRVKNKPRPMGYKTMVVRAKLSLKHGKFARYIVNFMPILESETFTMSYIMFIFVNFFLGKVIGTGANYFAALVIVPVLWTFISINYGFNPLEQIDFVATSFPLYLIFAKFCCFFAGCCNGIPWEHGVYIVDLGQKLFPVQLVEALWAVLIFIFLTKYRESGKAKTGTIYPLYVILYCATRFCSEFLRIEENVLGPLKLYHVLCLMGLVYGVVYWFVVAKCRDKVNAYYDKKYAEAVEELVEINKVVDAENERYRRQVQSEQQKKENEKKRKERQKKAKSSAGRKL